MPELKGYEFEFLVIEIMIVKTSLRGEEGLLTNSTILIRTRSFCEVVSVNIGSVHGGCTLKLNCKKIANV